MSFSAMKYRLIIFDFDGTLADSLESFGAVFERAVEKYQLSPLSRDEMEALRSCGPREIISRIGLPFWKVPSFIRHMHSELSKDLSGIQLFDGVREMLVSLRDSGCILALVTSNSEANVRAILKDEMVALFSVLECGASLFGKARRFKKVLRATGCSPAVALSIGDEIRDHEASVSAGIDFGAVAWGYTHPQALRARAPSLFFAKPHDIPLSLAAE